MRRSFHTRHTRRAVLALTALMMAAAFPMTVPSSPEYAPSAEVVMLDARASSDAKVVAVMPSATFSGGTTRTGNDVTQTDNDVTQTVAMMLVGTLLIGIGSAVRRVV